MDVQRHDSMYLLLPLCMIFLFSLLLGCNHGRIHAARDLSLLIYLLHPACIVMVRALARLTHTWSVFVESSLPHFLAVLSLTVALSLILYRLRPLPSPARSRAWREIDLDALRSNARLLTQAAGPGCE